MANDGDNLLQVDDWNHVHFALAVARAGTLSGAAEKLGVSHSTVLRRVDTLEKSLRTRLFYRHARGYVPTEAGRMLMRAAETMQDQLNLLVGRVQGADEQLHGALVVSTENGLVARLMPLLKQFQRQYPEVRLQLTTEQVEPRSQRGEAHIGIRTGARPAGPDYLVQPVMRLQYSLFAAPDYLREFGALHSLQRTAGHHFVACCGSAALAAYGEWLAQWVAENQIALRCDSFDQFGEAVRAGVGIAPLPLWTATGDERLRQLLPPPPDWHCDLWLFIHRDMQRTRKVRAFSAYIGQQLTPLRCPREVRPAAG